ncbi:acetyl-coenzyme A synthetase N-terminal domain-containing protein, partial [Maliponia aquimaris]|uniref:acetyl-coenzyme A synthetase N-terminal domain-containing protein n=1 Tax=Maliponia aquimaris TaxID=1673631 RepID=UPI001140426F
MTDQSKPETGHRVYPPAPDLTASAHVDLARYDALYKRSVEDPEGFWAEQAQRLDWIKPPTEIKNT